MGQGTEEQLTGQIADTRQDLSRDVDALYDKVSPGRMVERRKEAVRGPVLDVQGLGHGFGRQRRRLRRRVRSDR